MRMKCCIGDGWFDGERVCTFRVGDVEWSTCQSAHMCWRLSDGKKAFDIPRTEKYEGEATIDNVHISKDGKDAKDAKDAYVRYWFAHDHETSPRVDPVLALTQIRDEEDRWEEKPHTYVGTSDACSSTVTSLPDSPATDS